MRSNSYDLSSSSSSSSRKTSIFFPTPARDSSLPHPGFCNFSTASSGFSSANSSVAHVPTATSAHDIRATSLSAIWEWSSPSLTAGSVFSGQSSWSEPTDDDYDFNVDALARGLEELDMGLSRDLDLKWNMYSEKLGQFSTFAPLVPEEDAVDPIQAVQDHKQAPAAKDRSHDRGKIVLKLPKVQCKTATLPPVHIMKYHEVFSSTFYKRNRHGYMFIKEANDELLKTENNAISVALKLGAKNRKLFISVNKMSKYEMFNDFKVVKKKGSNVARRFGK